MIIILKNNPDMEKLDKLLNMLSEKGFTYHFSQGQKITILGIVGDTVGLDPNQFKALDIVEGVKRIQEPYKLANRKFYPQDTIVDVGGVKIGGGHFQVIAGPCSVESQDQICGTALLVKEAGATILRGGAFKPRTSPYTFQGLRKEGVDLLLKAKIASAMPIVTEVMDVNHLSMFDKVDMIQVGARNMQNYELLKELGSVRKPILLKRGAAATLEDLLMSAEYIMASGNNKVVLCERGIKTFETATVNTLDLSAVPLLKELTHLPVIVDPSHATGIARIVKPMALAAAAAGADGVMIEVHHQPEEALCDGAQSLDPKRFKDLMQALMRLRESL